MMRVQRRLEHRGHTLALANFGWYEFSLPEGDTMWPRKEMHSLNRVHLDGFILKHTSPRHERIVENRSNSTFWDVAYTITSSK